MTMQALYPLLINNLLTAILVVDESFNIVWANATAEQTLLASTSQLCQHTIFELLQTLDQSADIANPTKSSMALQQQFAHCRALHQAFIQHDVNITGLAQPLQVDYGVSAIDSEQGFYYLVEVWAKDRQSRIHQEQQQYAQHHATRQLIRGLAHEVKNPLAGIHGASQLLQKNLKKLASSQYLTTDSTITERDALQQKTQNYLAIILEETKRLNNLVNQLLGSSTLPTWQWLNIHEPIEQVLALVSVSEGMIPIEFVRDYDLSLPELLADKDALIQVLLNIINNALQALQESPVAKPTITVRTRVAHQYTIGEVRHKSLLMIEIIDNGMGIDSDLLPQIFYPLVTGRATGTGLGLALVQEIIHRHHGAITVASRPYHTVFSIYLPWQTTHNAPSNASFLAP